MDSTRSLSESAKNKTSTLVASLGTALQDSKAAGGMFAALLSTVQTTASSLSRGTMAARAAANGTTEAAKLVSHSETSTKNDVSSLRASVNALAAKPRDHQMTTSPAANAASKPAHALANTTSVAVKSVPKEKADRKSSFSNDGAHDNQSKQGQVQIQNDKGTTASASSTVVNQDQVTTSDPAVYVDVSAAESGDFPLTADGMYSIDNLTDDQELLAALSLMMPGLASSSITSVNTMTLPTGSAMGFTSAAALDSASALSAPTASVPPSVPTAIAGLQDLMQAIKTKDAAKTALTDATGDPASGDRTANSAAADPLFLTSKSATLNDAMKDMSAATASDVAQNFFDLFKNGFSQSTVAALPVTATGGANTVTASADMGGSSLDLNLQQGSANPSGLTSNAAISGDASAIKGPAGSEFANQLAAARSATSATLPTAVEQVVLQLSRNIKAGNDQMMLQLNPAELGRINVKLSFSTDGKVQGTVVADSQATLNVLIKDQASLERALNDAGLSATPGSLQFSLGGQSNNGFSQMADSDRSSRNADNALNNEEITNVTGAPAETYYLTPGGVNLHV